MSEASVPDRSSPDTMRSPVVARLAPSPTGGLHLGNARTFLLAWLLARRSGGRIVFRMEDLDAGRARADAAEAAIADLRWLGLDWDEGPDVGGPHWPYVQSARTEIYRNALERLIATGLVYPCTCTRAEVARMASAPHAEDEPPAYPGTCAWRSADDARRLTEQGTPFAWRFRARGRRVAWTDVFFGPQCHEMDRIGGDFIVARSGDVFSYQLAVVVDDGLMGVNQVVRGRDLIDSTPRQILIQEALGLVRPEYRHVGLVLDRDGKRLAKRDLAVKIGQMRTSGIRPEAIAGVLARSLGVEIDSATPERLIEAKWPIDAANLTRDRTIDPAEFV
ncbi:tRNA glutamyl-Q(34) synthetase GluQRS [bacterium]|nr:tRNA glutamyl-Q(34) synthetase GluQRS [bacterium]